MFFQKKSLCIFFGQKMVKNTQIRAFNFTTVDYPVYWTFKITLSSIGFDWKKSVDLLVVDLLVSEFLFVLRFISDVFIKW